MSEYNNQSNAIKPEELKAFHAVLKQHGCQENDFQARTVSPEGQHIPKKDAPQQGAGTLQMESHLAQNDSKCTKIAVKNNKTAKEKTYQAGEGSHWVKDFENDLKGHQFK